MNKTIEGLNRSQSAPGVPPPPADSPLRVDETGVELKRGAFLNTLAMLASNLRAVFTLLVAWLLGPSPLGLFAVAWATTDLISKIAVFGLDNAITTFIARSEALGERGRSRMLFRLAVGLSLAQSAAVALVTIVLLRMFGGQFGLHADMISALTLTLCALPGVALYRVSTSVSRGMKVMKHDIFSRGMVEPAATALAFLIALLIGFSTFAPELAAIAGTAASGMTALLLASKLFRQVGSETTTVSLLSEARQLLGYAAPISGYQWLNTLISRLDVMMLGYFIGRAPGVTLVTVGIYSAVVETANGLRKVNQAFNPIFAPVVAGMTATGDHERAAVTYARLAQWMLWILLPAVAVMAIAGATILLIYGPAFREGGVLLGIVAAGAAISAFVSLGETAIMVQRPHLNLLHSFIVSAVAVGANLWLIPRFGVPGAAFGMLLPYTLQGFLRHAALRVVFQWKMSWRNIAPPVAAAVFALVPALVCRFLWRDIAGQIVSALLFLAIFGLGWRYHSQVNRKIRNPL